MKRITSILSLVIVLAMAFSMTAFAATDANEITITTDAETYAEGDIVTVSVELSGDIAEVAMVQLGVKYDTGKFSVDTATDRKKGYKCYNSDWYKALDSEYESNLGYVCVPSCAENPVGQVNLMYLSMDGYYIDGDSNLYGDDKTTTAAVLEFTALADVTIDASCFELVEASCLVSETDGTKHVVTLNQLASGEIGGDDDSNIVATSNREAVTEKATHQIGTAVGMTVTVPEGIAFQKMIWVIANGSERLYAKEIVDLSDIPVAGDIKVAATFVNGSHNDVYKDAEVVPPLTIGKNDFDAIFRGVDADKNEADYFTNEADNKDE